MTNMDKEPEIAPITPLDEFYANIETNIELQQAVLPPKGDQEFLTVQQMLSRIIIFSPNNTPPQGWD